MEKNKQTETVSPTENRRKKTSLNILVNQLDESAKIAASRKLTLTAITDEAFADYIAKVNNVSEIDKMLQETNGFWFSRDLARVSQTLDAGKVGKLVPYQKAYLYQHLKDGEDRTKVFEHLGLDDELKQINAINEKLQEASIFKDNVLQGYNLYKIALNLRAKLTPLQIEYLQMKLGNDASVKLNERRPDLFPELDAFTGDDEEAFFDEENINPALPVVLAVAELSKTAWKALPNSLKKKIHDAVKTGNTALAKRLAFQPQSEPEAVDLFSQDENAAE